MLIGHGEVPVPSRVGVAILDPASVFMLLVLAVLVLGYLVTLAMGVRWNRRHGHHPWGTNPFDEDAVWWMNPDRTRAAERTIARGERVDDTEAARDVCARARARMIQLRNPWTPPLLPAAVVLNALMAVSHTGNIVFGFPPVPLATYAAVILGIVAVTVLLSVRWRARRLHLARNAYLAHRGPADETRELPLPEEPTP